MNSRPATLWLLLAILVAGSPMTFAERPPSPFKIIASLQKTNEAAAVRVHFDMPPEHVIYAEHLHFLNGAGDEIGHVKMPEPIVAIDKVSGREKKVFNQSFTVDVPVVTPLPMDLVVKFQGCSNEACYFPEKKSFRVDEKWQLVDSSPPLSTESATTAPAPDWKSEMKDFKVVARQTGYISSGKFLSFLEDAAQGRGDSELDPLRRFKNAGMVTTVLLMLVGGLGLNFTPCVLPLIPVNLAIIGAGKSARNRRQGFTQGAIYGAGMAVTYGVLGVVVVTTGAKFGALNSRIWFNVIIALFFVLMSLAMFDKILVDFSRFHTAFASVCNGVTSRSLLSFVTGSTAALLAGACVAPVVISVLLLSANLYGKGLFIGLLLPFVLGLGMALPWPFAGASLSFLPKPGRWMLWVKYSFGILILVFAAYYGHVAYGLFQSQRASAYVASAPGLAKPAASSEDALTVALERARTEGKPILIDFGASWCKNCVAMDETVFNRADVKKRLAQFVVCEYRAERPNDSPSRETLDRFGVIGLPTYIVLAPEKEISKLNPISSQSTNGIHL